MRDRPIIRCTFSMLVVVMMGMRAREVYALIDYTNPAPSYTPAVAKGSPGGTRSGTQARSGAATRGSVGAAAAKRATGGASMTPYSTQGIASSSGGGGLWGARWMQVDFGVALQDYRGPEKERLNRPELRFLVESAYDVYLDVTIPWMQSANGTHNQIKMGNATTILGFHWLKVGGVGQGTQIDLYGGNTWKKNNSPYASTRSDQFFGITTSKSLQRIMMGLIAEWHFLGGPSDSNEMALGGLGKFGAMGGMVVTPDISTSIELLLYRLAADRNHQGLALTKSQTFSTLTPKLLLTLSSRVNVTLGAHIRLQRAPDSEELFAAKLFDIGGAYGNAFFAAMGVTL